ncbi:hypothetical protein ABSA28_00757 [Candidatus Hepatincolaceae symbiont of Richtersius coronifer]
MKKIYLFLLLVFLVACSRPPIIDPTLEIVAAIEVADPIAPLAEPAAVPSPLSSDEMIPQAPAPTNFVPRNNVIVRREERQQVDQQKQREAELAEEKRLQREEELKRKKLEAQVSVQEKRKNELLAVKDKELEATLSARELFDRALDRGQTFKANMLLDYYGVPVLILRIDLNYIQSQDDSLLKAEIARIKAATSQNIGVDLTINENSTEGQISSSAPENLMITRSNKQLIKNPASEKTLEEKLKLQREVENATSNIATYKNERATKIKLNDHHLNLLNQFLAKSEVNKQTLIVMYVNRSPLKRWSDDQMKIERVIYSQYVIDYFYLNKPNVRIEKRYMEDIPEDEIFLSIFNYEGEIPANIYNAEKTSSLDWLTKYRALEEQRLADEATRKRNLEMLISSSGNLDNVVPAGKEAALSTESPTIAEEKKLPVTLQGTNNIRPAVSGEVAPGALPVQPGVSSIYTPTSSGQKTAPGQVSRPVQGATTPVATTQETTAPVDERASQAAASGTVRNTQQPASTPPTVAAPTPTPAVRPTRTMKQTVPGRTGSTGSRAPRTAR